MNRKLDAAVIVGATLALSLAGVPTLAPVIEYEAGAQRPRPGGGPGGRPHGPPRGGNHMVRNHSHSNVNHHHSGRPPGGNYHHNVNVDRHHDHHGYDHRRHHHDRHWDDHWHPVATAAAVTATAMVVGSIVRSIPPDCGTVVVRGYSYYQCGSTWYQPQYAGSDVTYIVVNNPR